MKIKFLILILLFIFSCSETEPIEQAKEATPEDLINHTEEFRKEIIDLISSTSDSSGVAKLEEKKIFNNLLKVHKKPNVE